MNDKRLITLVGVTHPWMCDMMGHVNVRHYAALFDDASFQLLGRLSGANSSPDHGWADVRCEIDYRHETAAGTLVTVRSSVTRIGNSSLTYRHEMAGTVDGLVRALAQVTSVRFDLGARAKMPIEPDLRERAEAMLEG